MVNYIAAAGVLGFLFFLYLKVKDMFLGNRVASNEAKVVEQDKAIADQGEKIKTDSEALNDALNKYRSDK